VPIGCGYGALLLDLWVTGRRAFWQRVLLRVGRGSW
jgi:hypothetical protein